jgi:hypothetical protein
MYLARYSKTRLGTINPLLSIWNLFVILEAPSRVLREVEWEGAFVVLTACISHCHCQQQKSSSTTLSTTPTHHKRTSMPVTTMTIVSATNAMHSSVDTSVKVSPFQQHLQTVLNKLKSDPLTITAVSLTRSPKQPPTLWIIADIRILNLGRRLSPPRTP